MGLVHAELETWYDSGALRTNIPLEADVQVVGRVFETVMRDSAHLSCRWHLHDFQLQLHGFLSKVCLLRLGSADLTRKG